MATASRMVLLSILLVAGCAPSQQQQRDLSAVSASRVPSIITMKMENNAPLDLDDIETLSRRKVDEAITLRYLRSTRTIYFLDMKAITELRKAGASEALINYLLSTPTLYQPNDRRWNPADNPTRDPLRNGQVTPRFY